MAAVPLAALAAGYTAFLFGQAEGRDLWQSPTLLWDLLAQAMMAGGGALLIVAQFAGLEPDAVGVFAGAFVVGTVAHLVLLAVEFGGRHASAGAAVAARVAVRGRY
ncbi:hypothetical protein [Actinophytocola sp.]|uniref:hypothetical protein n=1 Tax=Actinophytocola sp. TaxID=1872138 RepID=UPI0025BBEDBF|nr:hypothetical protein [Actinophytocola sp.]